VRWTFGRPFAEVSLAGYHFAGRGGSWRSTFPSVGASYDYHVDRVQMQDLAVSLTMGYRF
jgi:hypothetical protein